jgi:peptide/nickel transport system permease protein
MSHAAIDLAPAPPLRRPLLGWISGGFLAAVAVLGLLAPWIAEWRGVEMETVNLLARLQPPSAEHPLGTDELGRDLLLRLLDGGRISLTVGLAAAVLAGAIGTTLGLVAGYLGGRLDALLMRAADAVMSLPLLPLLIVLAALDPAKLGLPAKDEWSGTLDILRIVVIVALFGWTTVARLVRGATLSLKAQPFVEAARAQGAGSWRIMTRHILPNLTTPILVAITLAVGNVILLESVLSFLGLGIQPPRASWGAMLTNAQELVTTAPFQAVLPGLAIFLTVVSVNLLGEALQEALDPRARR